jgi:mannose-6-phosphate isomerase-like protein (cupin superfamily)
VPSDLAPGLLHWYIVEHDAPVSLDDHHAGTELHRRDSIDLVVVLDGSAELLLGDGSHPVYERDCIVMAGIDHGLRPGPTGCRLMSFAIGTPPASHPGTADDA